MLPSSTSAVPKRIEDAANPLTHSFGQEQGSVLPSHGEHVQLQWQEPVDIPYYPIDTTDKPNSVCHQNSNWSKWDKISNLLWQIVRIKSKFQV